MLLSQFSSNCGAVSGPLDTWLPSLKALEVLDASINSLTSTIPVLTNLTRLRTFSVDQNQLSGCQGPVLSSAAPPGFHSTTEGLCFQDLCPSSGCPCRPSGNLTHPTTGQLPCLCPICHKPDDCRRESDVPVCRLTGSIPDVGIPYPGVNVTKYPWLGWGGELYSALCTPCCHC